ncbi:hypothetical protein BDV96DRAFT_601682 [Lophiotrema nucula]|uniref:Uncharacterized protein n=1 Tax=Lophiotrema nucula TaxID=690887 RepID=A0A6A5Z0A0_9PLEO|nr:hypothetical protein BDV96DRAFT_601682 [Lophiotrema nucula]
MSQFPQAPPAGNYVPPPNESNRPSQGPGFNSSPYQSSTPSYGAPQQSHKKGFGQMLDQAVTTGKPMLNKLGKTISSKLGSKQPAPNTPQYLESYQNYQQHYQHQQPQSQGFSPQPQQQQWQQPQQPQNAYADQQSPYPQSNPQSTYATPASGHSGQNNYFPQQQQSSNPQTPQQQQPNVPGYNQNQYGQGQHAGYQQQGEHGQSLHQGQFEQNSNQGQAHQGQLQQGQPVQEQQFDGQQTGVLGTAQSPVQNGPVSPLQSSVAPDIAQQTHQQFSNQQQSWVPPTAGSDHASLANQNNTSAPQQQHTQPYNPTPPPVQQYGAAPAVPVHPNHQQQQQQQQQQPLAHPQQSGTAPAAPVYPGEQQQQQQQWTPMSPVTPQGYVPNQAPSTHSPPPPRTPNSQHQTTNAPPPPQSAQHQPTPPPQNTQPPITGPTEFIAELPADFGNLNVADGANSERPPSVSSQASPYQAYQPPGQPGRASSFTVARRAVSTSSLPLANPWRVADPTTELPTREFYILADLLFDALDRRCEPQNTGLLEASKILESWKAHGMAQEAFQLFQYDNYSAVGKLWVLAGIPHVMVPLPPFLAPSWNFQAQQHSHDMRIPEPAPPTATYPAYFPAVNRAGWYKYLFLETICQPNNLHTLLSAFCAETYKPSALNQPDLQKQDRTEFPALAARANAVRNAALPRVCAETAQRLQSTPQPLHTHHQSPAVSQQGGSSEAATNDQLAALQRQQQMNAQSNQSMLNNAIPGYGANVLRASANAHNTTGAGFFSV